MTAKELTLLSIAFAIFNATLLGAILCISWNYGVTSLSPNIPRLELIDAILIKVAFSAFIGKGINFSATKD
jgi:hypothetical protein